jgi:hypothetical protein
MVLLRRMILGVGSVILAMVLSSSVHASFAPRIEVQPGVGNAPAAVLVNGKAAVRFMVSNGNLTPTQRANITADRLRGFAASGVNWNSITTRSGSATEMIVLGDNSICVVTTGDARANNSDRKALAGQWVSTLRRLLQMPPIKLSTSELVVPLGESRTVDIEGSAVGPIDVIWDDPDVATTEVSPDRNQLRVAGHNVGGTLMRVTRQGETAILFVQVRKYAGKYRGGSAIEVMGEPAPGALLKDVAEQLAYTFIEAEPGAKVSFGEAKLLVSRLERGRSTTAMVPVTITGESYIPARFDAEITLINRTIQRKPSALLFYSNDPERVQRYQQLYMGKLEPDVPTRLLYHHQNGIGKRMHFNVTLVNQYNSPAKVQVISGISRPLVDTVVVGYLAGSKFLRDYLGQVGYYVTIPPRSSFVLYSQMLDPLYTASGILEFRSVEGRDVAVRVAADLPETAGLRRGQVARLPDNYSIAAYSDQVYPMPTKKLDAKYTVGGHWAFIGIGRHPLRDIADTSHLMGNYGVFYEIKLHLENPTPTRQNVSVVFDAGAGLASAVVYIDGKFVETKYIQPTKESPLATFQLEPQQTKVVSILTLPLSGSFYPASIVVKPI